MAQLMRWERSLWSQSFYMTQSNRDARLVAYRALCVGALLKRGIIEAAVQRLDQYASIEKIQQRVLARQRETYQTLLHWIQTEHLETYLSRTERLLIEKPLASWSKRSLMYAIRRAESLGVMLWALRFIEVIPPYDTLFDITSVMQPLDIFNPTIDFIWQAGLRPVDELRAVRDIAELWNWRSRASELQQMGVQPPAGTTFSEIIRYTAETAYARQQLPLPIEGDFPVFGKAYARLTSVEYTMVSAIAAERYLALNWMCELSSEWESIPVD